MGVKPSGVLPPDDRRFSKYMSKFSKEFVDNLAQEYKLSRLKAESEEKRKSYLEKLMKLTPEERREIL